MRPMLTSLSKVLENQSARLIHAFWIGVVFSVALGISDPLTLQTAMVLAGAALPGLIGVVLGAQLKRHRDSVRFIQAIAWTLPGLAATYALSTVFSPAALVFLVGPAALSASGLRADVRLSAAMNALAFVLCAAASVISPLSAGVEGLASNAFAGVALAGFFAVSGFFARVRLLGRIDHMTRQLDDMAPAALGFTNAPMPMLALDTHGRIMAVSHQLRNVAPGAPRNLSGLDVDGLAFDNAGRSDIARGLEKLSSTEAHESRFSFAVRTARGARDELNATAIKMDGGFVLALDRTKAADSFKADQGSTQLAAERDAAIAANRSKSEFLAAVSHELRTPLNAIIGFSDIIKQRLFGPLPARYAEYGDLIHESGEHLLELIGDVLDMSKIEADRYEVSPEDFDARDVLSICTKMMGPRAKDRGLALYSEPGDLELRVHADRKAMRQILLNLLSNAVKFTPEGGAVVAMARQDGADLVLAVGDSGVGIDKDELEELGKPYHQTRSGRETTERGTGLGLSLVQALTELQGGEVKVQSAPGEGTTVTIRLPVISQDSQTQITDFAPLEVHQRIAAAQEAGEVITQSQVNNGVA